MKVCVCSFERLKVGVEGDLLFEVWLFFLWGMIVVVVSWVFEGVLGVWILDFLWDMFKCLIKFVVVLIWGVIGGVVEIIIFFFCMVVEIGVDVVFVVVVLICGLGFLVIVLFDVFSCFVVGIDGGFWLEFLFLCLLGLRFVDFVVEIIVSES